MSERSFHRVRFNTDAAIVAGGGRHCFHGSLENISLSGLFIRTDQQVRIGEMDDITLPIPTISMPSGIKLKGTVVRLEENGIAYRISDIDPETFTHLKFVLKNKVSRQVITCLLSPFLCGCFAGIGFVTWRRFKK